MVLLVVDVHRQMIHLSHPDKPVTLQKPAIHNNTTPVVNDVFTPCDQGVNFLTFLLHHDLSSW